MFLERLLMRRANSKPSTIFPFLEKLLHSLSKQLKHILLTGIKVLNIKMFGNIKDLRTLAKGLSAYTFGYAVCRIQRTQGLYYLFMGSKTMCLSFVNLWLHCCKLLLIYLILSFVM